MLLELFLASLNRWYLNQLDSIQVASRCSTAIFVERFRIDRDRVDVSRRKEFRRNPNLGSLEQTRAWAGTWDALVMDGTSSPWGPLADSCAPSIA